MKPCHKLLAQLPRLRRKNCTKAAAAPAPSGVLKTRKRVNHLPIECLLEGWLLPASLLLKIVNDDERSQHRGRTDLNARPALGRQFCKGGRARQEALLKTLPTMTLAQFTEPTLLVPCLLSDRCDGTIIELSKRLENTECIANADSFANAVLEHEALASAVFDGVAFPLARGRAVKELSFAVGLAPRSIRWGTRFAPLVHAVVLFAVPLSEGPRYLALVLTFTSLLKDGMTLSALRCCVRPEEMLDVLGQVRLKHMGHGPANASSALAGREG